MSAFLLVIVIITIVHFRANLVVESIEAWVVGFGLWAPLVFMSVYLIGPPLFLPGSILTMAGGALFGPLWGTVYSLTAATAGATVAFFIARYLISDWVMGKISGKLKQLVQGVNAEGWRFVAFIRLVPIFPFNLSNYAMGLTKIRGYHYVVATFVCMIPGAFAYSYFGYTGREAVGGGESLITKGLLALSLLAGLTLLPSLVRWFYSIHSPSEAQILAPDENT